MHEQIFEISIVISESVFRMRSILHVDMNNFYASVECLYRPEIRIRGVPVPSGNPQSSGGGGGRPAEPARHHTGQEHDRQKAGRDHRRSHLGSEAESTGAGAGAAGLQKISALFPHGPGNLLRILRPGGGLRAGRKLDRPDAVATISAQRSGERGQHDPPAGEGRTGRNGQRRRFLQQNICQTGQRLEKTGRHHGHPVRTVPGNRVADAGERFAVRGQIHRPQAGTDRREHHWGPGADGRC